MEESVRNLGHFQKDLNVTFSEGPKCAARKRLIRVVYLLQNCEYHENKPIQIYRKFHLQKLDKNSDIFHISAQKIDRRYPLESPHWGDSNEYPQSMFSSKNKKMYSPVNPSFTIWKWGLRGWKLYRRVFVMKSFQGYPVRLRLSNVPLKVKTGINIIRPRKCYNFYRICNKAP